MSSTTTRIDFSHWIASLVVLTLLAIFSVQTWAQSSVRPPENATLSQSVVSRNIPVPNPAADLWREVRNRDNAEDQNPAIRSIPPQALAKDLWLQVQSGQSEIAGSTQAGGVDAGILINAKGEQWRNFRMEQVVPFGGYLLGIMVIVIGVFYGIRGTIKIKDGRSGLKIMRFTVTQRTIHWTVAITFLLLGLTGLVLLFGRMVLIPVIGGEAFSVVALGSKRIHDFVGPVFGLALILQFFLFVRGNLPHPRDLMWIIKGGGLFGGHASSHRYNAGEKGWFWIAMLGGMIVVVTGLVLDFPIFGLNRDTMVLTHVVHSVGALIILAASLGHIYMGTIGTQYTFEIMKTGYCDTNWAKEHHDLWYEDMKAKGKIGTVPEQGKDPSGATSNA